MTTIEKDLLTVEHGYICHQVNCQGVMGSGIAKQIREKWPVVFEKYHEYWKEYNIWPYDLLGQYLSVPVGEFIPAEKKGLVVVNIFGQFNYGMSKQHTELSALNTAFSSLAQYRKWLKVPIYFPYKFASDRGGADWNEVSKMIEYYFPDATICKFTK